MHMLGKRPVLLVDLVDAMHERVILDVILSLILWQLLTLGWLVLVIVERQSFSPVFSSQLEHSLSSFLFLCIFQSAMNLL